MLTAPATYASMKLTLHNNGSRYAFDMGQLPVRIGRSLDAEIRADDRWVSRFHCQIDRVNGDVVVRDLGSKHGTYVNGRPIDETTLTAGDELRVGLSSFVVVYSEEPAGVSSEFRS